MSKINTRSYTHKLKGKARVIITPAALFIYKQSQHASIAAIWDTGASASAITTSLVKKLGLIPTGMT